MTRKRTEIVCPCCRGYQAGVGRAEYDNREPDFRRITIEE
jgi:hypothetical protein